MATKKKRMGFVKKLYVVHGWTYSLERWKTFSELIKSAGIEPIFLKVPGLTSDLKSPWSLDDYVLWLKNELKAEKDEIVLLGHSNGGRISLAYMLNEKPKNIAKLILIDSAGVQNKGILNVLKKFVFKQASVIGKKVTSNDATKKAFYKLARVSDYYSASPIMKQTMINLLKSDGKLDYSEITVPTIIIWGEKDTTTPIKQGKFLANTIPTSQLSIVKDAKHAPYFTHPEEVADIIAKGLL
jgi:pimeloyl-ACP methyl ester carboxylesterase